ncbi:Spo0B domain-containing protein [Paenibacillus ehimensis]|uniref:Spo0B domain-containing protein n=1 Tax=Paenibacillus ehimensis TaxID=79264 RepID=A0ABT8VL71_9BACL|nr:Spo0B domain-containing protein [Paenibacillus ehimensis]MDO3681733.1 Spo0B domain-containing protein [Paenibacillus ehimensis]MEC0213445.1 Spo0B domain-containing protein [Paenibacillus ehimensis]
MTSNAQGRTNDVQFYDAAKPMTALGALLDGPDSDLRLLRLFNHYRHDWMNDIQILMGYVQLKKYDKLLPLMEKIKEKVRQESYVSKLGIPSLIVYLLTFQAEVKELRLEIALEEEIHLQELMEPQEAADAVMAMLACFREEAGDSKDEENVLELRLVRTKDRLKLTACYEGKYAAQRLQRKERALQETNESLETYYGEHTAVWTLWWSYRH